MQQQPARAARRRLPRARRLTYGVLAVPLVLTPLATAAEETDGPDRAAVAATDWTVAGAAPAGPDVITLITGDTVQVTTAPDGLQMVSISPASDGGADGYWTHEEEGDLYVVPHGLMPLIPERLDPALFNVSELVEAGYTDATMDSVPLILTYQEDAPEPVS